MDRNTIVQDTRPEEKVEDVLTGILRSGAQKLLTEAIEAEVSALLAHYSDFCNTQGQRYVVRNGYLPEREIQTGIGPVEVKVPRVRDRSGSGVTFTSGILPPYLRRTKSLEELIPWLYLKGVSTGDFTEALSSLLGKDAPGLSASTVARLKDVWQEEYATWEKRSLIGKRYVYFWIDGIYLQARLEEHAQCILIVIGADLTGKKELVAIQDGFRESEQSWLELLLDLKHRGLKIGPDLATGDGALGFWKALPQVYGQTRRQRCWVHKTGNILNKMPKSIQPKAKQHLHNICMAETKAQAEEAFAFFLKAYQAKYPKAAECLKKDREELLTFYDFPAEHWIHMRTTNPIESTFATIRLRSFKTKGCMSRKTGLAMVFKLACAAEKKWRKLTGSQHIAEIIKGVNFKDGIAVQNIAKEAA